MALRLWLRHRRLAIPAVVFLAALAVYAGVRLTWPAMATSGGDPYSVPVIVDTNPDPNIVETTIVADEATVDIGNGVMAHAQTFNGQLPAPVFNLKIGDTVIVHFENHLDHPTGIHWHGIELANASDGTPLTQNQVAPGGSFLYKFRVSRPGIYWYHPHHHASTNQVFKGLYGPIVIRDPNEAALQASGVLPSVGQTLTLALSDITVCKAPGTNDARTFPASAPWIGGGSLPDQGTPPVSLCETSALDEDGMSRGPVRRRRHPQHPAQFGRPRERRSDRPHERKERRRASGDALRAGRARRGASTYDVTPPWSAPAPRQHLDHPLPPAAAHRQRGNADPPRARGRPGRPARQRGRGGRRHRRLRHQDLLGRGPARPRRPRGRRGRHPRQRHRCAHPVDRGHAAHGNGVREHPHRPRRPLQRNRPPVGPYTIAAGTPLRAATGDLVPVLGGPTTTLLDPSTFSPAKAGLPSQDIKLKTNGAEPSIDDIVGSHDFPGDYTAAPHEGSTRYAKLGDRLELTANNTTSAHHPFHLHGFSIQPISLTDNDPGDGDGTKPPYVWPYREFRDNIDVPPKYKLTYRVQLDDRALMDGVTPGGGLGRWVFHCHIFFHATLGMISEFDVVAANGNERPYVNAGAVSEEVNEGQVATMNGTSADPDGDGVTYSASLGTVTKNGGGSWTWNYTTTDGPTESQFVYVTATDAGGRKDQAIFALKVDNLAPVVSIASPPNGGIVQLNQPFTLTAPFTDAGTGDTHTCSIAWGDSTTSPGVVTEAAGSGTCTATHAYTTAGFKTITATVTTTTAGRVRPCRHVNSPPTATRSRRARTLSPANHKFLDHVPGRPTGRRHGDADGECGHAGRARE
jgi:FtsP/CotA-like multicopper oxidase with cupredoxin domain